MALTSLTEQTGVTPDDSRRVATGRFYHPELDVLRFFACFMVFTAHTVPSADALLGRGLPETIVGVITAFSSIGGFGVDILFVLSAYLITELLLREKSKFGEVDVRSFYLRRIFRIWPLYFVFLFPAVAASGWLTGRQDSWSTLLAFTLLGGNWWVIARGWPSLAISPLWSLSMEEQLYLVWPPLVRWLSRRQLLIACGLMATIASSTQLYLVLKNTEVESIGCNTIARLHPIAFGIITAVLLGGRAPKLAGWIRLPLFAAGLGALLFSTHSLHTLEDPVRIASILVGYPLVSVGSVIMLVAILSETPPWFARGPLVYLGRISYGLYVFHMLALILVDKLMERLPHGHVIHGGMPLTFLLTVTFAALSFHFFETPFLRIKERFARIPSRP